MSSAQKNKGSKDDTLNEIESSFDDIEIGNNIFEENSPRLKKNKQSFQQVEIIDANGNYIVNKI